MTGITAGGSYVVQYFTRTSGTSRTFSFGLSCTGTSFGSNSTGVATGTATTWSSKQTQTVTAGTGTSANGLMKMVINSTNNSSQKIYFDDICIYAGSSADVTAPNAVTGASATAASTTSLNVSWSAASGGVDGGGYVVVRYTTNAAQTLNQNGIYGLGNTAASGSGTIAYIGTGTSFTDASLTTGTTYYYSIFTCDKAFNYSAAVTCNGTPGGSVFYNVANSDVTNVNNWGMNTDGSGAHPGDFTTNLQQFNLYNSGATMGSAWTVSGTGSKVVLGDGSVTNSFTIPAANALSGTIDVANNATLNIANTSIPTFGTLATGSTVAYTGSSAQTVTAGTYHHLTIGNTAGATLGGAITTNGTLTISSGATLDVSSANNYGVTVNGNWVNNGTFTPQAGTVTFGGATTISGSSTTQFKNISISASGTLTGPSSGTFNVSGNWVNAGTFAHNSGTVVFNGTTTISGASTNSFYSITINSGSTLTGPSSGTWNLAGNMTNNGTYTHNSSVPTFNGTGNQTVTGLSTTTFTTITINNTGTSGNNIVDFQSPVVVNTVTSGVSITLTAGIFKLSSASTITPFGGSQTIASGTGVILNHANAVWNWGNAGSLTLNGSIAITSAGGTMTIGGGNNSLVPSSGASVTLSGGTLNVKGRYTATTASTTTINGGTLVIPTGGSVSGATTPLVQIGNAHTFSMTSGGITVRSRNTNATPPVDISITQPSNTITGGTVTISDVTVTINSNIPLYDFVVDNNAGTAVASLSAALTVSHNLTINSGTLLANNNNISVAGNWSNSGTYTPGTNTVTFSGGSAQHTYTRTGTGTFYNLTLNDANGLLLNNDLTVSNTLTLTNGSITLGNNNLTLSSAVSGAAAFGSTSTKYIVTNGTGKLFVQNIGSTLTGDVLFPVGNTSYNPLVINGSGLSGANTFGVSVSNTTVGGATAAESVNRAWAVSHSVGTDAAIVKVQWTAADENGSFTRSACQLVNSNGSSFTDNGTIAAAAGSDPYTQTSAIAFNSFSTIGVVKGLVISYFYNKPGTDITDVNSWGTATDGTGGTPNNFTDDYQNFNITNSGATMSTSWSVSGTGSGIYVGDGTNAVTFTQTQDINSNVNVKNNATLQIQDSNIPAFGSLASGSTVDYSGNAQAITAANYGNLTLSGSGSTFPSGTVGISGTFAPGSITAATQGTVEFNGGGSQTIPAFNYYNLSSSNSGARTLAASGTIGIAGAWTMGGNSYTITGSTINYNGSAAQSIVATSYYNLSLSGSGTRSFPSGTVSIAGSFAPGSFTSASQGTIAYNGSTAQTIGAFGYNNLTCANSAGTSIAAGTTVSIAGTGTTALNVSAGTLTVNGTLENKATAASSAGNITSTTSSLVVGGTGTYKLSNAPGSSSGVSFIPTATWNSGSTLYIAIGATGTTADYTGLWGVKQTFSNVTIDCPSFDAKLLLANNATSGTSAPYLAVGGNLNVVATGSGSGVQLIRTSFNNNSLSVGGNYTQSGGTAYVILNSSSTATRTLAVAGDVTLSGGTLGIISTSSTVSGNNGTLTVGGNLSIASGATLSRNANSSNATGVLQFTGATGDQVFTNNGTFSGNVDVVVNKTSGNVNLGSDLSIGGSLTLTSGTLNVGTNNLTLKSTATRTAGSIDASNGTLTLNGGTQSFATGVTGSSIKNLVVNNTTGATFADALTVGTALTLTNGTLAVTGGLTLSDAALITRSAGALTAAPAFAGVVDVLYTNGSALSGNLYELPASSSALRHLTLGGNTVTLGSDVTVNGTATFTSGTLAVGSQTLTLKSTVTATGGTLSSSSTGTVIYADGNGGQNVLAADYGNLTFNGGGKTLPASGTVGIAGTLTDNASGHTVTGSTISFNGGGQNIPYFPYNNLQTAGSGAKVLQSSLNLTGDLSIGSGTILGSGGNNIGILGNWVQDGLFLPATGTVSFYSSGAQSISGAGLGNFYDLSVSKSSGNFTVGISTNVANRLQLEDGNVVNGGNLVIASGGKVIRTNGSLDAAPAFAGVVDLEYANSSDLSAGLEVPATDIVRDLSVVGGGNVALAGAVKVNGTLNLGSGIVDLGGNDLTATAGSVSGGSSASYVRTSGSGAFKMRNIGSTPVNIPVGNSTYNPLDLSAAVTQDWSVRVEDAISNVSSGYTGNLAKAVSRQWDITPATTNPVPVPGATVTFYYNGSTDVGASFSNATDLQVWHYYQGYWSKRGGAVTPGTANGMKTVTVSGLTYFSPYALSNIDAPLPVTFIRFTGKRTNNVNELKWTTASEQNNRGFAVERSQDGVSFTQVGFVATRAQSGTSTSDISYNFTDASTGSAGQAANSKWYYRLKQVDLDGQYKYSAVVLVKSDKNGVLTVEGIYPNPVKASANIRLQAPASGGQVLLQLSDLQGRVVKVQSVTTEAGSSSTVSLDLSGLASGSYHLRAIAQDGSGSEVVTVVKQ